MPRPRRVASLSLSNNNAASSISGSTKSEMGILLHHAVPALPCGRTSAGQPPAIHHEIRARDVCRSIAGEKYRGIGNVLRPAEPRPRSTATRVLEKRRVHRQTGFAGDDLARRNAIANDE